MVTISKNKLVSEQEQSALILFVVWTSCRVSTTIVNILYDLFICYVEQYYSFYSGRNVNTTD